MTTIVAFQPTATQPFQFSPTLDGTVYSATITWNLHAQDWYFNLFSQGGGLVVSRYMAGSPQTYDIDLLANLGFNSTLIFRAPASQFEISP